MADTNPMDPCSIIFPETYSEWHRTAVRDWPRRVARSAAISALYLRYRATGELERGLKTPRVQFFCLHHVFPDEEQPFRQTLGRLSQYFDFVSWSEGVRMVIAGERPTRPVACFSSDDGFASNLAMAAILEEFGTTACFFLNPASLDTPDEAFAASFCRKRLQAQPTRFLTNQEVNSLLLQGHEIGNHTMTHVVCSETPTSRLSDEIALAKDDLEARFGEILHFAWPYGQFHQFSEAARLLVFETGHLSAACVVRGAHLAEEVATGENPDAAVDQKAAAPVAGDLCIRRDQMWAKDPVEHTLYFSAQSALNPTPNPGSFPRLVADHRLFGDPGVESRDSDGSRIATGLEPWDAIALPQVPTLGGQYAPSPSRAALTVRRRIARSSQMDQFRT